MPYLWAGLLLLTAIGLIVLELIVPSAGLLSISALAAAIGAVVIVSSYKGAMAGTVFFLGTCVTLGLGVIAAIRWWPYTPIGRRVLNLPPHSEDGLADEPRFHSRQNLVGQRGVTVTKMMPGGVVSIGDEVCDAISQGGAIEEGAPVRVVSVNGTRVLVREEPSVASHLTGESAISSTQPEESESSPASSPFEDPIV